MPFPEPAAAIAAESPAGAACTLLAAIAPAIITIVEATPRLRKNRRSFSKARWIRLPAVSSLAPSTVEICLAHLACNAVTSMVVAVSMKNNLFSTGQTVKIKPQVQEYGGKLGTVVSEGKELGWRVVKVKFDDQPRPVTFAVDEVERE